MYRPRKSTGLAGDQPGCTFFEGGVFKPQCWCLDHPALCSPSDYKAAVVWSHPELIAAIQAPPVVGAPATIDALLTAQEKAWQDQNAGTMAETQGNLDQIDTSVTQWNPFKNLAPGVPWGLIAAAGVGVFALAAIGGGKPRRYGR
jgi:hypothetical protein